MKLYTRNIFSLSLTISILVAISCNSRNSYKGQQKEHIELSHSKKSSYELAKEFLADLKNDKADTIIFYKRTYIGCCDFFNIFWSSHGKYFLKKIHADDYNQDTYSETIRLKDNKIFKQLSDNYSVNDLPQILQNWFCKVCRFCNIPVNLFIKLCHSE